MNAEKNDPKAGLYFGSTEQIISWLGRWFLVQTSEDRDEDLEQEIRELRNLITDERV